MAKYDLPCVHLAARPAERPFGTSGTGGAFAWPTAEPWPKSRRGIPFHGAFELWQDSFPEIPFPDGHDALQILWLPLWPDADEWLAGPESFQWRWCRSDAMERTPTMTSDSRWDPGLVLQEGVFDPIRTTDPPGSTLYDYLQTYVGGEEFQAEGRGVHERFLRSAARMFFDASDNEDGTDGPEPYEGMKLFGHPYPIQSITREDLICDGCRTPMRLLLSSGFCPPQEPIGISNLDGMVYLYMCQVCLDRPLRGLFRTS